MIRKIKNYIKGKKILYDILIFLYYSPIFVYYYVFLLIFSLFKIENNKIIIISHAGKGYGGSPKYICAELIKYNYNIFWATKENQKDSLPNGVNYVKYDSLKYLYHLATAKIRINDCRFLYGIRKRKEQYYIQTWHGCIVFKKVERAALSVIPQSYVLGAKNDSKMANLFLSNSKFSTDFFRKYFWYNGQILEEGCPRNDIIINNTQDVVIKVRKFFGLSNSEHICLYAPTFRVNGSLKPYDLDFHLLLKILKDKFKGNWKIVLRLHPDISHLSKDLLIFSSDILDASDYYDMQELLVATDFLITDYSSCIFDYAISKKPALIYASDIEEYKKDRNFEIELEDTPFPVVKNNNELKNILGNFNIEKYIIKLNKFYKNIGLNETGKSCKKVIEIINNVSAIEKNI